jgi:nucleotide-binding universal stress UspA family protein
MAMKILLAIDGSPCSEAAIRAVIRQFKPADTDVRVVHADEWPNGLSPSLAFAEGPRAAADVLAAREASRRRGSQLLEAAARQLADTRFHVQMEMREGEAEEAILDAAKEWHPDLNVVGSHGRTGLDRFIMGSVSERVVRHAPMSVQVVRA